MVGDSHRNDLVIGKTKSGLVERFGYVTPVDEASAYVRYCYFNSPYYGQQVLVLRRSNWTVIMKNGKTANLVLAKGC